MSRSNDAGHFFQTSDALATTERRAKKAKNKHGDPIKLPSKILAASPSPHSNSIFVAEAAGEVKLVNLESRKIDRVFSQGNAPLTCLAVQEQTLFAGSWDKNIYAIDLSSGPRRSVRMLQGHTDFVKCLLCTSLPSTQQPILISGGADASLIVWDISDQNFGQILHKLKGHTKAIQAVILDEDDPTSSPTAASSASSIHVFSSSSDREIRKWRISAASACESPDTAILAHETSVYNLRHDASGDLWTASADKTAKHLVRERNWEADTTLEHPDFVRDVLPFEKLGLVVTACRDEEVRVWDGAGGGLVCTYGGHYEEVTALVASEDGKAVVSVSIDGTVRRWSLDRAEMKRFEEERARDADGEVDGVAGGKQSGGALTAEEEAELADLMDDDD